jgi:hypothetical protein
MLPGPMGEIRRLVGRFRALRNDPRALAARVADKACVYAQTPVRRLTARTFDYQGHTLRYFAHPYNATWRSERSIEIPIARHFIDGFPPRSLGLELGNVLAYYQLASHTVVDKYEIADGVINVDVVDYDSAEPFDWIVSISTLEHVGVNEPEQDPDKAAVAIDRLRSLLTADGRLLITTPYGFSPGVDAFIRDRSDLLSTETFYKRGPHGTWHPVTREFVLGLPSVSAWPRSSIAWVAEVVSLG